MRSVARLTVLGLSGQWDVTSVVHGRSGHASLVAWSESSSVGCVCHRHSPGRHLSISSGLNFAIAAPEWSAARASGVVVGGAGAETLLFLVMAGEKELDNRSEDEEEDGEDGDREAGSVQAADVTPCARTRSVLARKASPKRGVDDATARVGPMAGVVCDRGEASSEENIQEDGDGSEEGDTTQAESEENAEDGVQDGCARHAFNGLFPCRNMHVLIRENGEEVAVDAEHDSRARKFEEAQASLAEAQEDTAESHDVEVGRIECFLKGRRRGERLTVVEEESGNTRTQAALCTCWSGEMKRSISCCVAIVEFDGRASDVVASIVCIIFLAPKQGRSAFRQVDWFVKPLCHTGDIRAPNRVALVHEPHYSLASRYWFDPDGLTDAEEIATTICMPPSTIRNSTRQKLGRRLS